jgi:hypothetical protein
MCCILVVMSASFEPGIYVKGDRARVCKSAAEACAATFDGFKLAKAEAIVDVPAHTETPVAETPESDQPESDEQIDEDDTAADAYSFGPYTR